MSWIDWGVVALYGAGLLALGAFVGKGQTSLKDYYLAGRGVPWWQSGISTMATQLGAISFVSAPAFVALKPGGGLRWLAYELALPLSMIFVMAVLIPTFYRTGVVSVYEYLERRFDTATQALVSALFQAGRGLGTAVSLLAGGLILSTALGVPTTTAILILGVVTVIYDMLGGMKGVIVSDVVQMGLIAAGIILCGAVAISHTGAGAAWASMGPERRAILDFHGTGLGDGASFGFWPMLLGGFFLYASYYGCDQSQVQRELSVGGVDDVRRSLLLNGLGRFPVVLSYCAMGIAVGAVAATPEFLERSAAFLGTGAGETRALLARDPDRMVPLFILTYLPKGLVGLLFVAVMSALMSSLDSALNSLSAATVRDFYQRRWRPGLPDEHYLKASKVFTGLWGLFCVGAALVFAGAGESTRQTTIVLINAVGSLLYGPILAAFSLGMLTRIGAKAVKVGIAAGVAANLVLWTATGVSWIWWNVSGFGLSILAALAVGAFDRRVEPDPVLLAEPIDRRWLPGYAGLAAYFAMIVGICLVLQRTG